MPVSEAVKVQVMLQTNNPNNGMPTGWCDAVQMYIGKELDTSISLSGPYPHGVRWALVGSDKIRIGRKTYRIFSYRSWYGNWCWDAVTMHAADAAQVINYLMATDMWVCEEAETSLFEKYKRKEPFTVDDFLP